MLGYLAGTILSIPPAVRRIKQLTHHAKTHQAEKIQRVIRLKSFAHIVHRPHNSMGRYVDASTMVIPGLLSTLLTVLWGYQDYRSIHHLFPKVSVYRCRRLFNEVTDRMDQMKAAVYRLTWGGLRRINAMKI